MTIIVIQRTKRLVTKDELTLEEINIVKTMLNVGNSYEEVYNHLRKCGHTVTENDKEEDINIFTYSTEQLDEEEINDLVKAVSNLDII